MARPLRVYVDNVDLERLEAWSKKRGWTKSQAVREVLRALTREDLDDPLLSASGMVTGLPPDLSTKIRRAVEETFIAMPTPRSSKTRARRELRRR